jgi:hypothetical protein
MTIVGATEAPSFALYSGHPSQALDRLRHQDTKPHPEHLPLHSNFIFKHFRYTNQETQSSIPPTNSPISAQYLTEN